MKKNEAIIHAANGGKNFYLLSTITEFEGIPILFTASDDYNDLYLCDCVEFRDKQVWLISKITLNVLMQLIAQKITVLSAFKQNKEPKIIATFNYDTGEFTQENVELNKISPENLPSEGAFAYFNGSQSDETQSQYLNILYWNGVVNHAKIAIKDGENLRPILSRLNDAVRTVKAAMA